MLDGDFLPDGTTVRVQTDLVYASVVSATPRNLMFNPDSHTWICGGSITGGSSYTIDGVEYPLPTVHETTVIEEFYVQVENTRINLTLPAQYVDSDAQGYAWNTDAPNNMIKIHCAENQEAEIEVLQLAAIGEYHYDFVCYVIKADGWHPYAWKIVVAEMEDI